MTHGPNGMHASQPRHVNTRKALRVYEETHTGGGIPLYISPETLCTRQRLVRAWCTASDRNVRHTSSDLRSFATLTDGSCVELCRLTGEQHQSCIVTRASLHVTVHVNNSIGFTANN